MAKAKRPLTQQDAFDLSPAVREAAWGLKGHLLRNRPPDEAGRPMTAPDVNADVRARFEAEMRRVGYLFTRDGNDYMEPSMTFAWIGYQAAHAGEVRELVEAATEIAENTENWNRAVIEIIGRQPSTGIGTERLRAALAKFHPTHQEKGR